MVSIGRTTILVNDLDTAKAFYTDAFDFATLYDGEVAPGLRTVHIGPDGPRGSGLWLMKTTSVAGVARVGAQTAGEPALVFYTESLSEDLARLASLGVAPIVAPFTNDAGFRYAHVLDNSGNEIVLVEWPSPETLGLDAPGAMLLQANDTA
jgi:catechol 2,3-dioxygenase-like lactoylglutathione lyase family enzyme